MSTTAEQRLFDRWRTLSRNRHHTLEPWLAKHIRAALEEWSEAHLALAIEGALKGIPARERQRLTLSAILKDGGAIRAWIRAADTALAPMVKVPDSYAGKSGLAGKAHTAHTALRVQLDVPYEDIAKAKNAGARWDPVQRTWYAPTDTANLYALKRWMRHPHLMNNGGTPPKRETQEQVFARKAAENRAERDTNTDTGTALDHAETRRRLADLRQMLKAKP